VGQGGTNFVPSFITVHVGDIVEWDWVSGPHTSTSGTCSPLCSPDGLWTSAFLNQGAVFTYQFNTFGTFSYYCKVHLDAMQGTVNVLP
jgi:plastocyanin